MRRCTDQPSRFAGAGAEHVGGGQRGSDAGHCQGARTVTRTVTSVAVGRAKMEH